ncbi:hypothetical protein O9649_30210, partial [Achromobacter dolens]|nr:hypothetical protein [Achromobacter dolens]
MKNDHDPRLEQIRAWLQGLPAALGLAVDSLRPASADASFRGTVAKLAMRQPFVLFKGLTFQKLCL